MVKWTEEEREIIRSVWEKVDIDETGPQLIARFQHQELSIRGFGMWWSFNQFSPKNRALIVYPWTERYFGRFGDIFTTTAILNNAKVANHGKVVLRAVGEAVENMDDIQGTYAALSRLHCEKLNVDPDNFKLLADCITITIACKLQSALNPQVQVTWQKFLSAVVEAMNSQYK